jgi:hypothetical protein
VLVIGTRDGLPANQPAVCRQQLSLLETGETTKDAQGMPRQDADTPRVRGPLRSEPSRSDPSHTAPYSWTSIPQLQDTRFPLGMLPRIAYHGSCSYQQAIPHTPRPPAPRLYIPYNPRYLPPKHHTPSATPHTHGCRRRLSHHNLKTGQPRRRPRRAPLVRARLAAPLSDHLLFCHRLQSRK